MSWLQKIATKPLPFPVEFPAHRERVEFSYDERRMGYDELDSVMTQEVSDAEKSRFEDMSYKGSGAIGVATDIGNNRVRKYTVSKAEADAATSVQELQPKCMVPVYGVEQVQLSPPIWAIDVAKVKLMDRHQRDAVDDIEEILRANFDLDYATTTDADNILALKDKYSYDEMKTTYIDLIADIIISGFSPGDAHSGNVGWYDDRLVLFDLGGSYR